MLYKQFTNQPAKSLFIFILIFSFILSSNNFAGDDKIDKNQPKDIVSIAANSGQFNTLALALSKAELIDALKSDGPFTVFAPTDEAFAKLPKETLDNLLKDKEALKNILLYHVVSGSVTSGEVLKLNSAETLSGKEIKIKTEDNLVMVNNSKVISADIKASNGVIHVIDEVLIP